MLAVLLQHYRTPVFLENLSSSIQSSASSSSLMASSVQYDSTSHRGSSSHETGVITGGSSTLSDIISLDWVMVSVSPIIKQTAMDRTSKGTRISDFNCRLFTNMVADMHMDNKVGCIEWFSETQQMSLRLWGVNYTHCLLAWEKTTNALSRGTGNFGHIGTRFISMWTFSSFYYLNHTFLNNRLKTSTVTFIFEKKNQECT